MICSGFKSNKSRSRYNNPKRLRFDIKTSMIIDMNRRGFTIVELVIVIFIIGVLLVLGVANLRGSQANARDTERKGDIETIALHLESFYQSGTDGSTSTGDYPSSQLTSSQAYTETALRDIDIKSITAPGITVSTNTFKSATNNTETTAEVSPQPTVDEYIYQPLQSDGSLCTLEVQECRRFNLYYHLESDDTIYMLKSKNR